MVGIFFIGLFMLITTACENKSLELKPLGADSLVRNIFDLYSSSQSIQDSVLIGSSKTLYSGYVEDYKISTILLSIDSENIKEHPICYNEADSLKNLDNIHFELFSVKPLMSSDSTLLFDKSALFIGLSSDNIWYEEDNINDSRFAEIDWNISTALDSIIITENSIKISIIDSLQLLEWCNSQNQYLIVKYTPNIDILNDVSMDLPLIETLVALGAEVRW